MSAPVDSFPRISTTISAQKHKPVGEGKGGVNEMSQIRSKQDEELLEHLAATLRLAAHFGWTEGVRNHFSVEISNRQIAVQNENIPWNLMTASDLVLFDINDTEPPKGVSVSAFYTHRDLHRALGERARCIMHLHPPFAAALSCTDPGKLEMCHQNAAYFYGVVGYHGYPVTGTETTPDGSAALVKALGKSNRVLLQANHGVLIVGESVHACFDDLFYFENACMIYCRTLATCQPMKILDPTVCKRVMAMRDRDRDTYGKKHLLSLINGVLNNKKSKL
jgi:ribulose-5-phosphate 4-epimerase/fuculose-1-phosphate aldolase